MGAEPTDPGRAQVGACRGRCSCRSTQLPAIPAGNCLLVGKQRSLCSPVLSWKKTPLSYTQRNRRTPLQLSRFSCSSEKPPVPGSQLLLLCARSLTLISSRFFHPIPLPFLPLGSASEQIAWASVGGVWVQTPAHSKQQSLVQGHFYRGPHVLHGSSAACDTG